MSYRVEEIKCVLHLGSNQGYRQINLELAEVMISNHIGEVVAISEIYETEAWGVENQAFFLNVALLCTTTLSPNDVLRQIHSIESKMGRIRKEKWGPRLIDIDIIFYGEEIIKNPNLIIPHPQLTNRNFVLKPLLDICPDKVHPALGQTMTQLAEACLDDKEVWLFDNQ